MFTWKQHKQNRRDVAKVRSKEGFYTKSGKKSFNMKPKASFWGYIKSLLRTVFSGSPQIDEIDFRNL